MNNTLEKPVKKDELLNSMYDAIFKSIIQNPKFRKSLSLIISEVTDYSSNFIYENLVFQNTELPIEHSKERRKITDIVATVDGAIINIEANKYLKSSMILKNNLYHHKLAYETFRVGENVNNLEVTQITFNVVTRFGSNLFEEFSLRNKNGKYMDEPNFKRIHINMENPLEKYYTNGIESLSKVEKILIMFQITSRKELLEIAKGDEDLENMAKIIEDLNEDENIIGLYDKEEMDAFMKRVDRDEALKEGHEAGFDDGQAHGIKEVAKNMLKANMEISEISKLTGLTETEIEKL